MAGDVYVNGGISDKAGTKIDEEAEITVKTTSVLTWAGADIS